MVSSKKKYSRGSKTERVPYSDDRQCSVCRPDFPKTEQTRWPTEKTQPRSFYINMYNVSVYLKQLRLTAILNVPISNGRFHRCLLLWFRTFEFSEPVDYRLLKRSVLGRRSEFRFRISSPDCTATAGALLQSIISRAADENNFAKVLFLNNGNT